MEITNTGENTYIINSTHLGPQSIGPGETLEVSDDLYTKDWVLQNHVNRLVANEDIEAAEEPVGFPIENVHTSHWLSAWV
jgi:hypothetical protein